MKTYYVYIYLDRTKPGTYKYPSFEFNYEPFYVGKGTKERWRICSHIRPKTPNNYLENKINKLYNNIQILFLCGRFHEQETLNKEIEIINIIGRKDLKLGSLCNLTDGGEGVSLSLETKEKISKANMGRIVSQETKQKISQTLMGHSVSLETRKKRSKTWEKHRETTSKKVSNSIKEWWKIRRSTPEGREEIRKTNEKLSKIRLGVKRQPHTEESKKKMRESQRKYRESLK